MRKALGMVVAGLAILAASGCSSLHGERDPGIAYPKNGNAMRVAVLPFYNISGVKDADKIVYNIYVTELFKSGRFNIEEPGNVRQFLIQERAVTVGEMEIERLQILGKRLKVDAVITGTVEEFDEGRGGAPVVSLSMRMVESGTGRILWYSNNKRRGDEYIIVFDIGNVRSAAGVAQKVIKEMIGTIGEYNNERKSEYVFRSRGRYISSTGAKEKN